MAMSQFITATNPFTLNNIYYEADSCEIPKQPWIAGYGLNDGNADFECFPSMDGIVR